MPGERMHVTPERGALVYVEDVDQLDAWALDQRYRAAREPGEVHQQLADTSTAAYAGRATPCRVCGGPVAAADAVYDQQGWRAHPEHAGTRERDVAGYVLTEVLGRRMATTLTDDDAVLLLHDGVLPLPYFRVAVSNHDTPGKPWSYVTRGQRRDLIRAIVDRLPELRAIAAGAPVACTDGPCGMCGTVAAQGWVTFPGAPTWPAGGTVPFCGTCAAAHHDTSMTDGTWDGYARSTIRACTGVLVDDREAVRFAVPPFARDHHRDDPAAGQAWAYLDRGRLDALRLALYLSRPVTSREIPPAWRDRVAAARAADHAARTATSTSVVDLVQLPAGGRPDPAPAPVAGWFA